MPYWFDGNNLIGQSAAESKNRPKAVKAFLNALSQYRKSGGGRFSVYFDGDDPNQFTAPPGVRIRYSAPLSADDAIVARLGEISRPAEVIVVSNDRSLQSRCRGAGAKVMDWQQFASKMNVRKSRKTAAVETNQPEIDVDDWMEYFGMKDGGP
ncbi:MAG: NYN domain-containing protein [Acidobacteriota bacterium]